MNEKTESDILLYMMEHAYTSQRQISEEIGCSLGVVNRCIKKMSEDRMLNADGVLSIDAKKSVECRSPRQAIILAAGTGMRMVPINMEISKGMLEVKGEALIERVIWQLHESGIRNICIVVGFMKEQYEYLIDKYQVDLIVNQEYASKNNLLSLACAVDFLDNAYVIPSDIWCEHNPFHRYEAYSWYMVREETSTKSNVALNRKGELIKTREGEPGNEMIGIAYLEGAAAKTVREKLKEMIQDRRYDDCFWEESLYDGKKMLVWGKTNCKNTVVEINTYEQLRQFDSNSNQLDSDVIRLLADIFHVQPKEICDIQVLKKGMTNRSFQFSVKGKKYIMRIPGEGTDHMINRSQEYQVYQTIKGKNLCDNVYYMNPDNGYKVTEFIEDIRVCDAANQSDVKRCMNFLRDFHQCKLKVGHEFDLFGKIEFYENLWDGKPSVYRDYQETKDNVMSLQKYIDRQKKDWTLTHIDAIPDNFLISEGGIKLIDWEYAAMQDPHLDIAMFVIYSLYNRKQADELMDLYFTGECSMEIRKKIYCYIAAAGLLWSNWCEYKRHLGVEFGEYSLRQYRYAKDYYRLFKSLEKEEA